MASNLKTIRKAQRANTLAAQGRSLRSISTTLAVSVKRVEEYLEPNGHKNCMTCGGFGVNKQRSTGVKKPICT